jgi:hypothetical protein
MEKEITVKKEYNTLDKVLEFAKNESEYDCSIDYDIWDMRTDANGQMEKCLLIKKSNMHGMKIYFTDDNVLSATYIIPNKVMNAYFGKSQKAHKSILEVIGGGIKSVLLAGSQKKAFDEMELILLKIAI